MSETARNTVYRIAHIRPWAAEGTDQVPTSILTFFDGKEGDTDDLHALAASFGGRFESMVSGAARHQMVLQWNGHHYDFDLEVVPEV